MTMLEKAARAAATAYYSNDYEREYAERIASNEWEDFIDVARAVMEAVRVPDDGVKRAIEEAMWDDINSMPTMGLANVVLSSAIDHILTEGKSNDPE